MPLTQSRFEWYWKKHKEFVNRGFWRGTIPTFWQSSRFIDVWSIIRTQPPVAIRSSIRISIVSSSIRLSLHISAQSWHPYKPKPTCLSKNGTHGRPWIIAKDPESVNKNGKAWFEALELSKGEWQNQQYCHLPCLINLWYNFCLTGPSGGDASGVETC